MVTWRRSPAKVRDCLYSLLLVIVLLGFSTATSTAQETLIPLEGLDPVMLAQGKEVQGDMKYKVTRGRFQYLFANAENKATFEKDPSRYEIQLDGHCARMGAPTGGNPDLYCDPQRTHLHLWIRGMPNAFQSRSREVSGSSGGTQIAAHGGDDQARTRAHCKSG